MLEGTDFDYLPGQLPDDDDLVGKTVTTYIMSWADGRIEISQFYHDEDGNKRRRDYRATIEEYGDVPATAPVNYSVVV